MTKAAFYSGKALATTEWWLNREWLPELVWGRLRVYDDGTADACFAEGVTLYGFDDRGSAARFLAQDDLSPIHDWAEDHLRTRGVAPGEVQAPTWQDPADQEFVRVGAFPPRKAGE